MMGAMYGWWRGLIRLGNHSLCVLTIIVLLVGFDFATILAI